MTSLSNVMAKHYQTVVFGIPDPADVPDDPQAHQDRAEMAKLIHHPWVKDRAEGDLLHHAAPPAADRVQRPAHYTQHPSGIEAITITRWMNFNLGNAMKYLFRAGHKDPDPREDLRKAIRYIEFELENLEQQHGPATGGAPSA